MSSPKRSSSRRLATRAAAVAGLVVIAALVSPKLVAWQQAKVADQLALRALAAEGGGCDAAIDQLAGIGLPGVEPLVRLAASRSPDAALAAREAVLDQLTTWEIAHQSSGDAIKFSEQLAILAAALELHSAQFDSAAWRWGQQLARRIVENCEHVPASRAFAVLTACDGVLGIKCPPEPSVVAAQAPPQLLAMRTSPEPASPLAAQMDAIPATAWPQTAPGTSGSSLSTVRPLAALRLMPQSTPLRETLAAPPKPWPAAAPISDVTMAAQPENRPVSATTLVDVPSPADSHAALEQMRALSDRELIARRGAGNRFETAAVEQALRERGFSDGLLEFVSRLERLPKAERREALQRIDALPAAEARLLLRWFLGDEEPTVRLEALTMLATSGDPRLAEIVRQRAINDADPRVAELANRIMREGAGRR